MKYFIVLLFICSSLSLHAQTVDEKIKQLGLELPPVSKPIANYVKYVRTGNLIFLAGHGPSKTDGTNVTGKVGKELSIEQGYEAAKIAALSLIATLKDALGGDLSKVKRIVKVNGYVNCLPDFTDHPKVINGCSDLLVALFGEKGKHARAAMGMVALPSNIAVEIEMIVEVED
ncbi:RidA family protein [Lacibacter sp. H407]|uniref:RidA family protein n=1 Tax=Lacibacter sp. H407 TaxID=3133423 RepID=UPI0030C62BFF